MGISKGPWKIYRPDKYGYTNIVDADGHSIIEATGGCCDAWCDEREVDIYEEEDARLIAAAPELLAACKAALEWLTENAPGTAVLRYQLEKAIKRAEEG